MCLVWSLQLHCRNTEVVKAVARLSTHTAAIYTRHAPLYQAETRLMRAAQFRHARLYHRAVGKTPVSILRQIAALRHRPAPRRAHQNVQQVKLEDLLSSPRTAVESSSNQSLASPAPTPSASASASGSRGDGGEKIGNSISPVPAPSHEPTAPKANVGATGSTSTNALLYSPIRSKRSRPAAADGTSESRSDQDYVAVRLTPLMPMALFQPPSTPLSPRSRPTWGTDGTYTPTSTGRTVSTPFDDAPPRSLPRLEGSRCCQVHATLCAYAATLPSASSYLSECRSLGGVKLARTWLCWLDCMSWSVAALTLQKAFQAEPSPPSNQPSATASEQDENHARRDRAASGRGRVQYVEGWSAAEWHETLLHSARRITQAYLRQRSEFRPGAVQVKLLERVQCGLQTLHGTAPSDPQPYVTSASFSTSPVSRQRGRTCSTALDSITGAARSPGLYSTNSAASRESEAHQEGANPADNCSITPRRLVGAPTPLSSITDSMESSNEARSVCSVPELFLEVMEDCAVRFMSAAAADWTRGSRHAAVYTAGVDTAMQYIRCSHHALRTGSAAELETVSFDMVTAHLQRCRLRAQFERQAHGKRRSKSVHDSARDTRTPSNAAAGNLRAAGDTVSKSTVGQASTTLAADADPVELPAAVPSPLERWRYKTSVLNSGMTSGWPGSSRSQTDAVASATTHVMRNAMRSATTAGEVVSALVKQQGAAFSLGVQPIVIPSGPNSPDVAESESDATPTGAQTPARKLHLTRAGSSGSSGTSQTALSTALRESLTSLSCQESDQRRVAIATAAPPPLPATYSNSRTAYKAPTKLCPFFEGWLSWTVQPILPSDLITEYCGGPDKLAWLRRAIAQTGRNGAAAGPSGSLAATVPSTVPRARRFSIRAQLALDLQEAERRRKVESDAESMCSRRSRVGSDSRRSSSYHSEGSGPMMEIRSLHSGSATVPQPDRSPGSSPGQASVHHSPDLSSPLSLPSPVPDDLVLSASVIPSRRGRRSRSGSSSISGDEAIDSSVQSPQTSPVVVAMRTDLPVVDETEPDHDDQEAKASEATTAAPSTPGRTKSSDSGGISALGSMSAVPPMTPASPRETSAEQLAAGRSRRAAWMSQLE